MIYFKIDPEVLRSADCENSRERLKEILDKFDKADKELEKICKELGIPKPEMVCS